MADMSAGSQQMKTSYYSQPEAENVQNSVMWQLDNDDIMVDLVRDLQCYILTGKNKLERFSDEPLINRRGIAFIMPLFRAVTSKQVNLGNLDDQRWGEILEKTLDEIDIGLSINYTEYGIKKERIGIITQFLKQWILFNSSRAIDGKEALRFAVKPQLVERMMVGEQPRGI